MNGQMDKYRASLAETPGPVSLRDCPRMGLDLKGMMAYAKSLGVQPVELSASDKAKFMGVRGHAVR